MNVPISSNETTQQIIVKSLDQTLELKNSQKNTKKCLFLLRLGASETYLKTSTMLFPSYEIWKRNMISSCSQFEIPRKPLLKILFWSVSD